MKALTLRQLFELARDNAASLFEKDHEVLPLWHVVQGNGDNVLIATPWSSDEEKDITTQMLRRMFAEKSVRRYVFVCECWMATLAATAVTPAEAMQTRASEHPDRREGLRITAEDRSGECISGHFYILRPEHGPPVLSPFHEDEEWTPMGGRLMGLLT